MTTYYVASGGSNSNSGLSSLLPWQTVAKVNAQTFSGDDFIGFNRGDTWAEKLIPPSSGTSGHPITFGAYGTGANPKFNKTSSNGIGIAARTDLVFQDIDLTNTGSGSSGANILGSGAWTRITFQRMTLNAASDYNLLQTNTVTTVLVDSITCAATGGGGAVRFTGTGNSSVTVSSVSGSGGTSRAFEISNVAGLTLSNLTWNGNGTAAYCCRLTAISGALALSTLNFSNATNHNLSLESCTATLTATGLTLASPSLINLYLLNSTFGAGSTVTTATITGGGSDSVLIQASANVAFTSVAVSGCTNGCGFRCIGAWSTITFSACSAVSNSKDGFNWDGSGSVSTATDCLADQNARDGFSLMSLSTVHDITCRRCVASRNGVKTNTNDGDGFTAHNTTYNFLVDHCIAYGNTQSGVAMIETSHGWVYHGSFYNNGGAWSGGANVNSDRGNIYIGISAVNPTTSASWTIKNSIAQAGYPVELKTNNTTAYALLTLDYNLYYHPADAKLATLDNGSTFLSWTDYHTTGAHETHSLNADPLFTNAGANDFTLQSGSPAIDAGVTITGINDGSSGSPHYSGSAPDIGAFEYISLSIADSAIALSVEAVSLTQANALAVQDSALGLAIDDIALTQANTLSVDDESIALTNEAVDLAQDNALAVDDLALATAVEAVALTQANVLAVDDSTVESSAETPTLTQVNVTAVDDNTTALDIDNVALVQANAIVANDAVLGVTFEQVTLTTVLVEDPSLTLGGQFYPSSFYS